ncbi:hypothetical protein AKUH4B114J_01540 [Apilactobacillus kunkeei]|uniref:hypothetical protein n=1 Tax=Apilactobacillus TaxID=2767877 RepID=UPI001C6F6251|nr:MULTISPECIES: hypothetical protein [Apilactobacillus]MBX8455033.1 hypothetical protein [Apilactobacillus kunkeei]MCK8618539.1 hypothetical protein [Apilactobacillus kunkeei]MDN2613097.1 hypothetical protein [Apilactobacillus sp. EABW-1NA]QYU54571.1 hypothetical protein K2W87_00725 [Apilactobacillus kunkeei]CAI2556828.1 hypothetical protein AKUH4B405J_01460 [Apilactobacillus kunkeei]
MSNRVSEEIYDQNNIYCTEMLKNNFLSHQLISKSISVYKAGIQKRNGKYPVRLTDSHNSRDIIIDWDNGETYGIDSLPNNFYQTYSLLYNELSYENDTLTIRTGEYDIDINE